jgi:Arc/MetJ-type ribon-helix-helix transcriptional regulator
MKMIRGRIATKAQKTVRLPKPLLKEAESLIRSCGRSESMNDFIVRSVRLRIDVIKRKELDAKFAGMSEDAAYQKESTLMAEEFESSDWETASLLEG